MRSEGVGNGDVLHRRSARRARVRRGAYRHQLPLLVCAVGVCVLRHARTIGGRRFPYVEWFPASAVDQLHVPPSASMIENCWLAALLSVHCTTLAPFAVEPAETSTTLPLCQALMR